MGFRRHVGSCLILYLLVFGTPPILAPGAIVTDVNGQSAEDRGGCGCREESGGCLPIFRHLRDPEKDIVAPL